MSPGPLGMNPYKCQRQAGQAREAYWVGEGYSLDPWCLRMTKKGPWEKWGGVLFCFKDRFPPEQHSTWCWRGWIGCRARGLLLALETTDVLMGPFDTGTCSISRKKKYPVKCSVFSFSYQVMWVKVFLCIQGGDSEAWGWGRWTGVLDILLAKHN